MGSWGIYIAHSYRSNYGAAEDLCENIRKDVAMLNMDNFSNQEFLSELKIIREKYKIKNNFIKKSTKNGDVYFVMESNYYIILRRGGWCSISSDLPE